jgi:aminoglycoside phosphotransferase (APT) family kinase protein
VLDWEMATVGPAGLDLGWMLFAEATAQHWLEPLPGFRSIGDAGREYTAMLGADVDLDWFLAWGGVRAAAVLVRLAHRNRQAGDRDAWRAAAVNPVTTVLCDRLGLPEPPAF